MGVDQEVHQLQSESEVTEQYPVNYLLEARYKAAATVHRPIDNSSYHSWDEFRAQLVACLSGDANLLEESVPNSAKSLDKIIAKVQAEVIIRLSAGRHDVVASSNVLLDLRFLADIDVNPRNNGIRGARLFSGQNDHLDQVRRAIEIANAQRS